MNLQSFCHHASVEIDFSPEATSTFACSKCKRDQIGFFAFLYAIAQHAVADPVKMATQKKGPKVQRKNKCGICGEEGHQARTCAQNPANKEETDEKETP